MEKIHFNCDILDSTVVNNLRQPILNCLVLDKPPGFRVFCQHETVHQKKLTNLF